MTRFAHLEGILNDKKRFSPDLFARVTTAHVLLVGAGGIGCELLKNLVCSGFDHIEIVDTDTIDISNLNRQFLFQRQHVKKAKAHVARESALRFNPSVHIKSHHAKIQDQQFDLAWFKGFEVVMNALDNIEARSYVNQMCIAADVPVVESGTEGYSGYCAVVRKDVTECYNCQPKETPKTFPVCTIRNTPSQPVHCIVWAKDYLFSQLFGKPDDEVIKRESDEDEDELKELKKEEEALKTILQALGTDDFAEKVFRKVFSDDIARLLDMEEAWKNRKAPTPLEYDTILAEIALPAQDAECADQSSVQLRRNIPQMADGLDAERAEIGIKTPSSVAPPSFAVRSSSSLSNDKKWTLHENFQVFLDSTQCLSRRLAERKRSDPDASLTFDKDDIDSLDMVTSAANLRAYIYDIERKSRFEVKSIAGRIIPAIATTNAVIAGLCVLQAFKLLSGRIQDCRFAPIAVGAHRDAWLNPAKLVGPNLSCGTCRNHYLLLRVDTGRFTLGDFVEKVLSASVQDGGCALGEELFIYAGQRQIYDYLDLVDLMPRTFDQLSLGHNAMIKVSTDVEDGRKVPVIFTIQHSERISGEFEVVGSRDDIPTEPMNPREDQQQEVDSRVLDDSDCEMLDGQLEIGDTGSKLAKRPNVDGVETEMQPATKHRKIN